MTSDAWSAVASIGLTLDEYSGYLLFRRFEWTPSGI